MRVPQPLAEAFSKPHNSPFEDWITEFLVQEKLLESADQLHSVRFLARSIAPHIKSLSQLFNRADVDQASGILKYWHQTSNPKNLRLAYFLYFMPCNAFRIASIVTELKRYGFLYSAKEQIQAIELGAGPAAGATGVALAEHLSPSPGVNSFHWALLEQDKSMLVLGEKWANFYFRKLDKDWTTRTFPRRLEFDGTSLLPRNAPKFDLWVLSYVLNEIERPAEVIAQSLIETLKRHLAPNGIVILSEPALKLQSRKLLEIRSHLLKHFQILLPCLGNQKCGAFAQPEDWCHEEVTWWRPTYIRELDKLVELDRKSLPFSYLVMTNSEAKREEILPEIAKISKDTIGRLVSPAYKVGSNVEFYICEQTGKRKTRKKGKPSELERGDLIDTSKL